MWNDEADPSAAYKTRNPGIENENKITVKISVTGGKF